MELKTWILTGLVLVMTGVLSFIGRTLTRVIIQRLDEIVKELRNLNTTTALHSQDIRNLQEGLNTINQRLTNHAERIREIELTAKPNKIKNEQDED